MQHIIIDKDAIRAFCRKWRIREFSLFGSVLREDFGPDSDVDVLVSFEEDPRIGLWDMVAMTQELEALIGRKADLVEKEARRLAPKPLHGLR